MNNHSVFVNRASQIEEYHDLSRDEAFQLALTKLYINNTTLTPNVRLVIRTPDEVVFTATNPNVANVA